MGFSKQEYWSGLPFGSTNEVQNSQKYDQEFVRVGTKLLQLCPTLCDPMDCSPPGYSAHGDSSSENTGVGCHALLQGIFLTEASNQRRLCLLCRQAGSLPLSGVCIFLNQCIFITPPNHTLHKAIMHSR